MDILAADIGGTNSRFANFQAEPDGTLDLVNRVVLKTGEANSFEELLSLLESKAPDCGPENCNITVLAVAGPVQRDVYAKPPNIRWEIDITSLRRDRNVYLINDFVAQAYGCLTRAAEGMQVLKQGTPETDSPLAVIGAGTGLGHSVLVPDSCGGFASIPSEAGHAPFPFTTRNEQEYMRFLQELTGKKYLYGDLVVSGRGLSWVHEFLTGDRLEPAEVSAILEDHAETRLWFARFYARACRTYALSVVPLAGMYVSGGVAAKNPQLVENTWFLEEFVDSPTQKHLLQQIPLFLNTNDDLGLWGGALKGLYYLGHSPKRYLVDPSGVA